MQFIPKTDKNIAFHGRVRTIRQRYHTAEGFALRAQATSLSGIYEAD